MRVIGFRCFTKNFIFVVLEGIQKEWSVVDYGNCPFPRGYSWGQTLSWVHQQVLELLGKYKIESAGIKGMENNVKRKPAYDKRFEVEGVVKETVYSKLNRDCNARIRSQLKRDIVGFTRPARYLEEVLDTPDLEKLKAGDFPDATLAAIAELPPQ